jgi:hypothetical protein
MPRSSSNSYTNSSSSRLNIPPPKLWHQAPPLIPVSPQPPVISPPQPGLGQIIKEGIGFGAGSAIGQRIVGSLFGPPTVSVRQETPAPVDAPASRPEIPFYASENYKTCLEHTKNDVDTCKPFLSKEKSPWTQCMEMNFYQKEYCMPINPSTK